MIIILAVLALVVVNALAASPWGVFSIGLTIPIALFMGFYLRYLRPVASWRSPRSVSFCWCWRSSAATTLSRWAWPTR